MAINELLISMAYNEVEPFSEQINDANTLIKMLEGRGYNQNVIIPALEKLGYNASRVYEDQMKDTDATGH